MAHRTVPSLPLPSPDMSPDQHGHKRRRVQPWGDTAEVPPRAVPPIAACAAPPSPPSPPLSSVSALALFAAEMVAWLWFAPGRTGAGAGAGAATESSGFSQLQVRPSDRFVRFCQEVLSTTQVSESVVLLALLFISRLKQRNQINGAPGSEYRLAVTGLMLANKILDDNTYTAQTWSQVSSLELQPLVAGEAEFLRGLDWSLHVSGRDFDAWRKLLDGHVAARNARVGRLPTPRMSTASTAPRRLSSNARVRDWGARQSDLRGLGIESEAPLPFVGRRASAFDDGMLGVPARYPRGRPGVAASTNTTPTTAFANYTLGAPASAPHAQITSAPLPVYHSSSGGGTGDPTHHPLEISPTAIAFHKRNAGFRSSVPTPMPGLKRSVDDAFSSEPLPFVAPALPPHVQAQPQAYMARSYSAGPAGAAPSPSDVAPPPAPPSAFYLHPAHHVTPIPFATSSPHNSRPSSSSSAASGQPPPPSYFGYEPVPPPPAGFSTLSDAFSPRYEPGQQRLRQGMSLGYYSLAAGHGLGHLHQTLPPPAAMVAPIGPWGPYPPYDPYGLAAAHAFAHASASSSPAVPPPFETYMPAYALPPPGFAHQVGALAAPPMTTSASASQFGPPPPPRTQGHRRTSSGNSLRGGGGGGSPIELTSTPRGPLAFSPSVQQVGGAPYPYPPPPPHYFPPPPLPPHMMQVPPTGYYSAYSNAGLPGVYFRG